MTKQRVQMKSKITFVLLDFITATTFSIAQTQKHFSAGLKAEVGMTGFISGSSMTIPGDFLHTTTFRNGLSGSLGITGEYYFGEKKVLGLELGVLANYASFDRTTEHQSLGNTFDIETRLRNDYEFYNLTLPLKINYRYKKITFSIGMAPYWHVYSSIRNYSNWRANNAAEWSEDIEVRHVEAWITDGGKTRGLGTLLDRSMSLHAIAGIQVQLTKSLTVGASYTNQLEENKIVDTFQHLDVITVTHYPFKYSSAMLTFRYEM